METYKVRQMLQMMTGMVLCSEKDDRMDHMFHRVCVDHKAVYWIRCWSQLCAEYFGVESK